MQAERDCVGYAITDSFPKKHQIGSAVPNWHSRSSDGCLRDNYVPSEGAGLADILPPARRFGGGGASVATRENVVNELTKWVERFRNLGEVGLYQE